MSQIHEIRSPSLEKERSCQLSAIIFLFSAATYNLQSITSHIVLNHRPNIRPPEQKTTPSQSFTLRLDTITSTGSRNRYTHGTSGNANDICSSEGKGSGERRRGEHARAGFMYGEDRQSSRYRSTTCTMRQVKQEGGEVSNEGRQEPIRTITLARFRHDANLSKDKFSLVTKPSESGTSDESHRTASYLTTYLDNRVIN